MAENEKGLTLFKNDGRESYCSLNIQSDDEKKKLFNTLESADVRLNDCVGQKIKIKDIYIEKRNIVDEQTGEIKPKFRTIIFDENGQTYATGAYGVYNVVCRILAIYGEPYTWKEPIEVEVIKRPINNNKQSLTFKLI